MPAALIAIDLQQALFDTPPADADGTVARIAALAARARAAGVPVLWVQHGREGTPLAPDSPGWALLPALGAQPGEPRVRKTTPDSFLRTGLAEWLRARGIDTLVVCGYASEFCVDTTVRRAAALGFAVTLVADGHTSHDKPHADGLQIRAHHNATLPAISSFGPVIRACPAADIDFSDRGRHPAGAGAGAGAGADPAPADPFAPWPLPVLQTEAALAAHYGQPGEASLAKVADHLTPAYRRWLEASPFVVLATGGPEGLDASPRGDPAPVVVVLDAHTLALPDRRGNQRLDSLRNLLHDDRVGLLALVPGSGETLRIGGRGVLSRDPALCQRLAAGGQVPASVLLIRIQRVYFQCARAVLRAGLWGAAAPRPAGLPSAGEMLADASHGRVGGADYDAGLAERQRGSLY